MSIRKITSATSSLVVSASTTRAGIFKATAQTQTGIKRIQNLSSILIPKISGAVPSIVDHLAYDPEGIGIRKYIEYLLASDRSELYITLNKSETVVASDYAFATLGFIRTFYDNVVPVELFDILLISNRYATDTISIRDTDYFLLRKSLKDTQTITDTDRLFVNLGKRDSISLTDTDRLLISKRLRDSVAETDAEQIWFKKVRADAVAGTEDLVTYVAQFKSDTITAAERDYLRLSKPFAELLVAADADRLYTIKRFFDPVISADIRVTFFINKRLNDAQPTIDLVGVYDGLNYNYSLARFETVVNTDYFSRIFNTIRGPRDGFTDTTTIGDRDYLWLNKAARDSVLALDVRTLYVGLRKSDTVTETDKTTKQVFKRSFDSVTESDDQKFWINKRNIDTVIFSDFFQSALGRNFVDSVSLTDTDRITFLKRLGDTEPVYSIVDLNDGNFGHHFIKDRALTVFTSDRDVLYFNKALRDSATSTDRDFLLLGKQFYDTTTSLDSDQLFFLKTAKQGNNTLHQRGNLFVFSEQFEQANWQKASTFISSNVTTAPNGSLTADKFIEGFGAAQHYAYQGLVTTIGNRYIVSFYVKPAEKSTFAVYFPTSAFGSSSAGVGYYTLVGTGTTVVTGTATGGIVQEDDGWYRCWLTQQAVASVAGAPIYFTLGTLNSYTGDGVSGLYIWGAQAEGDQTLGNYVPTTSSAITISTNTSYDTDKAWIGNQVAGIRRSGDILENVSFLIGARESDSITESDRDYLALGKVTRDSQSIADRDFLWFNKFVADTTLMFDAYAINDGSTYSIWKNVFDNVIFGEDQKFVFLKSLKDAAVAFDEYTVSDGLRYNAYKYAYDTLSQTDTEKFTVLKTAKQGGGINANGTSLTATSIIRGNLLIRSEEIDTWAKVNSFVSSNVTTAPDGTLTADKFFDNGTATSHQIAQSVSLVTGSTCTYSIFIKPAEQTIVRLLGNTAFNNFQTRVDLSSGAILSTTNIVAGSAGSEYIVDGWYRFWCSFVPVTPSGFVYVMLDSNSTSAYGVYVWGGQVEASPYLGNYVRTTSTAIITAVNTANDTDRVFTGTAISGNRVSDDLFEKVSFWFSRTDTDSLSPLDQFLYAFSRSERAADSVLITDRDYYWFNKAPRDSVTQTDTEKFTVLKTAKQSVMTTRGNLLPRSEEFELWINNTTLNITSNVVVAPNGTLTADTTNQVGSTRYQVAYNISTGTTLTYSLYVKPSDSSKLLRLYTDGGGYAARTYNVTPSTGVFSLGGNAITGNITTLTDGWYRLWFAWTHLSNGVVAAHIYPTSADLHAWWGAQLNTGIGPDNYIQTTSTGITLTTFTNTANDTDRVWIGNTVAGIRRSADVNETITFTMLKKLFDDQTVDEAIVVQKFTFLVDRQVFDSSTVTDAKAFLITTVDRDTATVAERDYLLTAKRLGLETVSTADRDTLLFGLGERETAVIADTESFLIESDKSDTTTVLERDYLFVNKVAKQSVAYKLQGNLLPNSEDFTQWVSQAAGIIVSSNVVTAPNGTLTADKLGETGTVDYHRRGQGLGGTSGTTRRFSIYAKAAERVHARGWSWAGGDTSQQSFDLVNGTVLGTQNPTMTYVVDGWWRCEFDVPLLNSTAVVFGPHDGIVSGTGTYAGVTGSGIYVWGGQLDATGTGRAGNYTATTNTAIVIRINDEADRDVVWVGTDVGYRRSDDVFETVSFLIGARESDSITETDTESFWINKTAKLGINRFNVEGNILTHSENVAGWASYSSGVVLASDSVTAPDGTLTADVLTFAGAGYRYHAWPTGNHQGQTLTGSVWVWSPDGSKNVVGLRLNDSAIGTDQSSTSITLTTIPTRYSITRTFTTTGTSIDIGIDNRPAQGGNNTSGSVAVWGLQLNSGTVAGPYVRTTNAGIYIVNDTANSTDRVRVGTYQTGNRTTFDGLEKVSFTALKRIADTSIAFDEYTISDGLRYNAYKLAFDTVSESDTERLWINKTAKDTSTVSDADRLLVTSRKTDSVSIAERDFLYIRKPARDAVTVTDTDRLWFNKFVRDSQTIEEISVVELISAAIKKTETDTHVAQDYGVLLMQNYTGAFYFAEDYVGISDYFNFPYAITNVSLALILDTPTVLDIRKSISSTDAVVTASDTSSAWLAVAGDLQTLSGSIDLQTNNDPTDDLNAFSGRPLLGIIQDLGLTNNLKLCLDAGDIASYNPAIQTTKWLDVSGNGYDFFRGTSTAGDAAEPTFNGGPGGAWGSEYWSWFGTTLDRFTYDSTSETWMDNLHKNNAKFTILVAIYFSDVTTLQRIVSNSDGLSAIGIRFHVANSNLICTISNGDGVTQVFNANTTGVVQTGFWHIAAISLDEAVGAAGALTFVNNQINYFNSTYTSPSSSAPQFTMHLGVKNPSGVEPLAAGSRMACVAMWEGTALTAQNLQDIYEQLKPRFGLG